MNTSALTSASGCGFSTQPWNNPLNSLIGRHHVVAI